MTKFYQNKTFNVWEEKNVMVFRKWKIYEQTNIKKLIFNHDLIYVMTRARIYMQEKIVKYIFYLPKYEKINY